MSEPDKRQIGDGSDNYQAWLTAYYLRGSAKASAQQVQPDFPVSEEGSNTFF